MSEKRCSRIAAFALAFGFALTCAHAAEEADLAVPGAPSWKIQEIRLSDDERNLKKGFLLTPPDDRPVHAVSEEMGQLVQSGGIDPERAYATSQPATKVGRDGKTVAAHGGEVPEETGSARAGAALKVSGDASGAVHGGDKPIATPRKEPEIPVGENVVDVPKFSDWKIQRVVTEDKTQGEIFSLKPPDNRPAGHISGPIAHRLFAGGLEAEMAYRTAVFGVKHKAKAGEGSSVAGGTMGGGSGQGHPRAPAGAKHATSPASSSGSSDPAPKGSAIDSASAATPTDTATGTTEENSEISLSIVPQTSKRRRCVSRDASTRQVETKAAAPAAKPAPPPEPPSNKTIQGVSEIWMDQPGSHRGTVTPQANCPKGYDAHPYYSDNSGLGGIIGDIGYDGFMGGGVFFCTLTDPEADKIVTDVIVTSSKVRADPCPSDYEDRHVIADCQQGFGAACAVPVLMQNFCVKKESISKAKVAVTDFGVTPTITAGLAHVSDVPCPEGYKTVGETTSCGGAAAYCSGKQHFCMKQKEIPPPEPAKTEPAAAAPTSAVARNELSSPEVVCLDDDSESAPAPVPVPKGKSKKKPSDITGTDKKKSKL